MIAGNTPLHVNIDTLWPSVSNKSKLQMFLGKGVIGNTENSCREEVETVFICFCAQNMTFPCQSKTEGSLMSL